MRRSLLVLLLLSISGCAARRAPVLAAAPTLAAESSRADGLPVGVTLLRFGSPELVPTGTFVEQGRLHRVFQLVRAGDTFVLHAANGSSSETWRLSPSPDWSWLSIPGHHGIRLVRDERGEIWMEIGFCYEVVNAAQVRRSRDPDPGDWYYYL